ncbi:type II toxin-antitoxin system HicA family toxin [Alicyclobacillus tolerans]|uniref:type II toxin-antitoxin system HicA family toxin n=1 Tax=Alicyclobacillus tolerans TaxID=90970 RepID=UPI001F02865D|nr:type II toxin-antitoxin system HicA family toxin [Alicyclobacillus tolerans]MCF8568159.1 type II toxin-antitoxin system HicA family toxin [Alicyclobacillus tolerans]
MSPHFPVMSGAQMMTLLRRAGFVQVSQKGSHVKMRHVNGHVTIVPNHRELAQGTVRSILRQAGLSEEDFFHLMDH